MYPFIRFIGAMLNAKRQPPLDVLGTHISHHRCYPWDLDPWRELNNGRTLTLYDLGRIPMAQRTGLIDILRKKGWGITVAGVSVRYRRRVHLFQRITMLSRALGWDHRFVYIEQTMWKQGECANQMLLRMATTGPDGIVPPDAVMEALGHDAPSPTLPGWAQAWIEADATRPWPPELPDDLPPDLIASS